MLRRPEEADPLQLQLKASKVGGTVKLRLPAAPWFRVEYLEESTGRTSQADAAGVSSLASSAIQRG